MRVLPLIVLLACGSSTSDQGPTTVGTTPADGPTYSIKLDRPPVIGQSYRLATTTRSRQAQTFTPPGAPPQVQVDEKVVELQGVMQRTGELTYWVEVESFQATIGASVQRPITAGTRIEVTRGDPGVIAINGEPVTGDLEDWIGLVVPDGPVRDDDEMYGTPDPQPIGGTWNFQPDVVSELLQRMRVQVPPEAIHGGLEVAEHNATTNLLTVRGQLDINAFDFPHMPDATVESGNVHLEMEWALPSDPEQVAPFRKMEMQMTANMRLQDPETGESAALVMEFHNHREATLQPM